MSKNNKRKKTREEKRKKSFLDKLPSNLPFVPFLRRPDYQLKNINLKYFKSVKSWKINAGLLIVMVFISTFFVYCGGFYYMTQENYMTYPDPDTGEPDLIWEDINEQTILEGFAAGTLMMTGASGFYLIHKSTHFAYSQTTALKYLLGGIFLVTFALIAIMSMVITKMDMWKVLFGLEDSITNY